MRPPEAAVALTRGTDKKREKERTFLAAQLAKFS
jgi:hypothetical protein